MSKILVVAAHPDDEVLGCGGTIARHVDQGDVVSIVFMADGVGSRSDELDNDSLNYRNKSAIDACKILGAQAPIFLSLPDNRMDSVAFLDIVKKLEAEINTIQPSTVFTHHSCDLNIDHRITHQAVLTACRPQPNCSVDDIYAFEVLSSTDWNSSSGGTPFIPNYFVDITPWMERKISALQSYDIEMRDFPHCRSYETVEALAKFRGSSVGVKLAESFSVIRSLRKFP
jgi:N-acetylglucosamine malate deacetylase 1